MTEPIREQRGRLVRETWVRWAREQPDPKDSWLTPWPDLDDGQREVDMRIGDALAAASREHFRRFATTEDAGEFTALYTQAMASGARDERERILQAIGEHSSQCSRGVHIPWSVIERALGGDGHV